MLFSSTSAVIGIPLQVAYAAANAGLDALAQLRQARGKAGLSVNWGALRGGGMADSSPEVRRYLEVLGQRDILVGHLPALLATILAFDHKLSNVVIANIDWRTLLLGQPALKSSTRFADFAAALGDSALNFRAELFALPADQRLEVLTSMLAEQVAAGSAFLPTRSIITRLWRSSVSIRCRRSSLLTRGGDARHSNIGGGIERLPIVCNPSRPSRSGGVAESKTDVWTWPATC